MSKTQVLNFSIGPVQSFIASARKTRDFWTGSFLLSYLAGQAMAVVLEGGGSLILPAAATDKDHVTDPLLQAIMQRGNSEYINSSYNSIIATLPNRFRAKVPEGFNPELCKQAIEDGWNEIANLVWERYLAGMANIGHSTEDIWQRQVNNFWDINWILSEDPAALDLRKNWRCYIPPTEPGDKCTLLGSMQELSGYLRIHEKNEQDQFWNEIRQQNQAGALYDLDENERLCAVAFIKRFFPYIAEEIVCKVPLNYPSTPYLASVNWIARVVKDKTQEAANYAKKAYPLPKGRENPDMFPLLQKILRDNPQAREFATLDGNCFFKATLENPNLWDRPAYPAQKSKEVRGQLVKKLEKLTKPSPFYAMLLMDGDLFGALLQKHKEKTKEISGALNQFSLNVPSLVESENGVTVYAGGDDVLAFMPLENALNTAIKLRKSYLDAFDSINIRANISGAIIYTHFNTPLTEVYHEAQKLLTDIAKRETGRDSLAVTVWKSAGKVLTWSAPWDIVITKFLPFLEGFEKIASNKDLEDFSNSFFYDVQNRLAIFFDNGEKSLSEFKSKDLHDLLIAEFIKNRGMNADQNQAREITAQMLELCRRYWNDRKGYTQTDENKMKLDSIFLAKFLLEKGV